MTIPHFLYKIGYAVCHQLDERSFHVAGQQLPLCCRCTGIYLGMFISFAFYFFVKFVRSKKPSMPPKIWISMISIIFILIMVGNAVSAALGMPTNNIIRFITGMLFGFTIPLFLLPAFNYSKKSDADNEHIVNFKEYIILFSITAAVSIFVFFNNSIILYIASYLSIAGLLLFMMMLNAAIITLIFDSIKKFKLMPYYYSLLIGALITGGELGILKIFHEKVDKII